MARAATRTRLGLLAAGALALAACGAGAHSPEEALARLRAAVAARDAVRLFDAVDPETRWAWMTVQRAHREAYDITLSNYPEGPDRERQLRRFEAGALAESASELFARSLPTAVWTALAPALQGGTLRPIDARTAELVGAGPPLRFRKVGDGRRGWGWSGLADDADQRRRRAMADLDLIRTSAADYERAATRGLP